MMAVLNYHYVGHPEGAVNIMRPSKWGVPWRIARWAAKGERDVMLSLYRSHIQLMLTSGEVTLEELAELYGRDLVCCCKPAACHGDILEEAAEWAWRQINGTK